MYLFEECPSGFYGEECDARCYCKEGTCDPISGLNCSGGCEEDYMGDTCSDKVTTTPTAITTTFSASTSTEGRFTYLRFYIAFNTVR